MYIICFSIKAGFHCDACRSAIQHTHTNRVLILSVLNVRVLQIIVPSQLQGTGHKHQLYTVFMQV